MPRTMTDEELLKKALTLMTDNGPAAIYDLGNEQDLPWEWCCQCEEETPTVAKTCLVCGTSRALSITYLGGSDGKGS